MKNPTGNKLEKLIFGMFDKMVEGADKYVTQQESTWLIFTDEKRWVIEFTSDKTLWFNYNLFQTELELVSKNCSDNEGKDLIKKWFESRFLNIPEVEDTFPNYGDESFLVEDTIQNGVKDIGIPSDLRYEKVNDIILNGVKNTSINGKYFSLKAEDTIQNGVKQTKRSYNGSRKQRTKDTIQNGVKSTKIDWVKYGVEDAIENGVKDSNSVIDVPPILIENVIKNGEKHTYGTPYYGPYTLDETVQNGVKHTEMGWVQYNYFEGVIQNGVKSTLFSNLSSESRVDEVIQNGVKEIYEDDYHHKGRIEGVINNGSKDGI